MKFEHLTDEELRHITISDLSEKQLREFTAELLMRILLKKEKDEHRNSNNSR